MKLNKKELEILDTLADGEAGISALASSLKMKKSNLSNYLKKLGKYGLVETSRIGKSKRVSINPEARFGFSALRGDFPTIKLSEILPGKIPFILAHLKSRGESRLKNLDLAPATAKRLLGKLRRIGLVFMPKKGVYHLRPEAEIVSDFCRAMLMRLLSREAEGELGLIERGLYSFDSSNHAETVFVTKRQSEPKHYCPTAYSIFAAHGVQIIQAGKYYYSSIKPDLGDAIIHTLALSRDARSISYAALLAMKNNYNPRLLLKKKQAFGLDRAYISEFVEFVRTRGEKPFQGVSLEEIKAMAHGNL